MSASTTEYVDLIAADALLELGKIAHRHGASDTAHRLATDSAKVYHSIGAEDCANTAKTLIRE
jgi:hypothetical protein